MLHSLPARVTTAFAAALLASVGAAPAFAAQDPGTLTSTSVSRYTSNCALTRVGLQLTRCDNLAGLGYAAHSWVPEG